MSKELLPCPFCDCNLEPVTINGQVNHHRHVLSKCMLSLEPVFCDEYRAWNTRKQQTTILDDKTPKILIQALRQYQHNDCSGLLAGFDYDETIRIVSELKELILHAWVHSGYINCGYKEMTTPQKALYDSIIEGSDERRSKD